MAPGRTFLEQVAGDELPRKAGFIVRVIRLWTVPHWGVNEGVRALHMVLQDEKGVRIQASIEEALINKLKDKIEEHGYYAMKNFRVVENKEKFKPCVHPFRFHFQKNTQVLPVDRSDYHQNPLVLHNTKGINDIFRIPPSNMNDLIDFIGAYFPKDGLKFGQNTQGTSNYVSFHLIDLSKKSIYCSLWDTYGEEAKAKLENCGNGKFVVVLLQLCRATRKGTVTLSTSFHVSKVLIDEHIPEIEKFRRDFRPVYEKGSQSSSYLSASSASSSAIAPGPVTTIANLYKAKEAVGNYFYGEIMSVDANAGWYLKACPNPSCDTEVETAEGGYFCSNCKGRATEPLHKYKVRCMVKDKQTSTTVVLFDEDCHHLIGKSVSKLQPESDQNVGVQDLPKEIMGFVGRCFLFKVGSYIKEGEGIKTYNIESVCDDPKIVALNQPSEHESSEEDLDSDDDLSLMFPNATEVDSNATPWANEESMVTPSSKRRHPDNDDGSNSAPTSQGSSNKKMKDVKIEKP